MLIFIAGVSVGFAVAIGIILFMVAKKEDYDWLKDSWRQQLLLSNEKNALLQRIVEALEKKEIILR